MNWITHLEIDQMQGISPLRRAILHWLCDKGVLLKGKVLNVGAGDDLYKYRRYLPNITEYVCLDKVKTPNINILADAENMSMVESKSFDGVLSTSMLYYPENPERAVAEIYRVLKDGGLALLELLGPGWRYDRNRQTWRGGGGDGTHRFTVDDVKRICNQFEVLDLVEYHESADIPIVSSFVTLSKLK